MFSPIEITAIYCMIDDILKSCDHKNDTRAKLSDAEILLIGIVAANSFGGVFINAYKYLYHSGMINQTLSKSRLCRRLHGLRDISAALITIIGKLFIEVAAQKEFIVDSTPLPVCHNIRINKSKLLGQVEDFRGYTASMKTYFYGIKLQLLCTLQGVPVSYAITEGSLHDAVGMKELPLDLTPESKVYADSAYTDYEFEDQLPKEKQIEWMPQRKGNSKRKRDSNTEWAIKKARKRIETTFSNIKDMFHRTLRSITIEGYMRKIEYFILAYQLKSII